MSSHGLWRQAAVVAIASLLASASASAQCPPAPASGCLMGRESRLSVWNRADDAKDQLLWKWSKGEALAAAALADPTGTARYALCLYAGSAQALVAAAELPAGSGWRELDSGGVLYTGPSGEGMRYAALKPGALGGSSAMAKGKGSGLPDPDLPLATPVTVQLRRDDGALCLQSSFAATDAEANRTDRFKADARASVPSPAGTIPLEDLCNKSGDNGSIAEQIGAQLRRSGTEWATTCLAEYGSSTMLCEVAFPGDSSYPDVPDAVPSLVCPQVGECDHSLGRIAWHAENKFIRKCTLAQWQLVWGWIQARAGAAAPPDCDVGAFAPGFWGVYACYEEHFVAPLLRAQLAHLRAYESPAAPMTPACEGAIVTRLWWRLASDWIRHGDDVCRDGYLDLQLRQDCATDTSAPRIDQATWNAWCDESSSFLRPIYEGVRAASGKPY